MSGLTTFAFQVLNLGIIIWLFRRYFYPAVKDYMARRAQAIAEETESAHRSKREAEGLFAEGRATVAKARQDAAERLAEAEREAARRGRRAEEEARDRARAVAERARMDAERLQAEAYERAARHVTGLALELARRSLEQVMDEAARLDFTDRVLDALGKEVGHESDQAHGVSHRTYSAQDGLPGAGRLGFEPAGPRTDPVRSDAYADAPPGGPGHPVGSR